MFWQAQQSFKMIPGEKSNDKCHPICVSPVEYIAHLGEHAVPVTAQKIDIAGNLPLTFMPQLDLASNQRPFISKSSSLKSHNCILSTGSFVRLVLANSVLLAGQYQWYCSWMRFYGQPRQTWEEVEWSVGCNTAGFVYHCKNQRTFSIILWIA